MKKSDEQIQRMSFQDFQKALSHGHSLSRELKVLLVLSYFLKFTYEISEHNLLILFRHTGLDLTDEMDQTAIYTILSYYCGANVITILNNGLGIKDIVEDPQSSSYLQGRMGDESELTNEIQKLRARFFEDIAFSEDENGS